MQMDIEIQSDIFGFIDVRSVVVEIKLQQIRLKTDIFRLFWR